MASCTSALMGMNESRVLQEKPSVSWRMRTERQHFCLWQSKTHCNSAADFTWKDPVNLKFILKFNIGISIGVNDVNLCLKKCNANPYCMSINFMVYKGEHKKCYLKGISVKAAGMVQPAAYKSMPVIQDVLNHFLRLEDSIKCTGRIVRTVRWVSLNVFNGNTGVNDVNLCLKKCNANPYCMSIDFMVYKGEHKKCYLNGISVKAAGSAHVVQPAAYKSMVRQRLSDRKPLEKSQALWQTDDYQTRWHYDSVTP
ncbi:hypothetical protein CAPTEDRAFT_188855 [Capitella teleta]|uniref:Apple domain-containing protein n=1 Tax=Capitella teleta TaxID=283909 RepID=R7TMY6_CAPTE|nr:hypothetical protein CAPTEDRAFT_188855 [Capitella teleta]|eukprot:ELT95004.1 hypothetical protein CAPTEDRAFT_188855 [Capitella teleta]